MSTTPFLHTLAQTPRPAASEVVLWIALLLAALLAGSIAIFAVRKKLLSKDAESADGAGIMETLRAMKSAGTMSDEEYTLARRAIVEKLKHSPGRTSARSGEARTPDASDNLLRDAIRHADQPARKPPPKASK